VHVQIDRCAFSQNAHRHVRSRFSRVDNLPQSRDVVDRFARRAHDQIAFA